MIAHSDVLIIGGGIIGAACACELARRGASVTVIDKGEIGSGCSYGSAGWVTPCFAFPLPMPGTLLRSLKWMLDRDSPLYLKPSLNLGTIRWLLRFMRSMTVRQMLRSVAALTELSAISLGAYQQLNAEQPGALGFQQRGLLMVAQTAKGYQSARRELELVGQHNIVGRELDADEVKDLEPAITGSKICGGVYFPNEAHVEPHATVLTLLRSAQKYGASVHPKTEVFDFVTDGRHVIGADTTAGFVGADSIVLAAGAWSGRIARTLKLHIPMLSGKGYAVIVEKPTPTPVIPCMLIEKKVAVTPREHGLRLAGTLELVDLDESITVRRVNAILNGARQYLSVPADPQVIEVWRGLRPCTPDGVPIIGRVPGFDNVVVATGHQMLGLQTAPATASLVADLVAGQTPIVDPQPFRVDRF